MSNSTRSIIRDITRVFIWLIPLVKENSINNRREVRANFTEEADLVRGVCAAHGRYETAEVCGVRRIGGGACCVGGQENEWMSCFLDDLRAFGISANQWATAAQDEGEWRRTAEQGAERFMVK